MTHPSNYVFPVIEDSPGMATERCPMCGHEVDRRGECVDECGGGRSGEEAVGVLLRRLTNIALVDPRIVGLLLIKVDDPSTSIRDLASRFRIKHSAMQELAAKVERLAPEFAVIVGGTRRRASFSQRRRRKREGE